MIRAGLTLAGALLLLLGAMALKGHLLFLPSPPPAAAAEHGGFDAERAHARLARVLGDQSAHPVDSAENDAVRMRLIAELRTLGLTPRVSDDFACNGFSRTRAVACARVRNIVATIGPAEGRHLLLSAHYDSTFAGPGAGDAGIGVATLLETAALLRGRALSRPVTLLFNEGEEMGLIGARAFLARDPVAPRIAALLNFEARGVTGPATMFESSRPNGAAIAWLSRAADGPVANSLATDLYRLIPNSTDVAVFEDADWTILNFAILGNETRYHSQSDDLAALDRDSLQHMGEQALALVLDFQAHGLPAARGERLFVDLMGLQLVTLPLVVGLALLGALLLFFLVQGWRRKALGRPLIAMVAGTAGSAALAGIGQMLVGLLRDGDWWRGHPAFTETAVYASALAALLAALALIARRADLSQLRAACWLAFVAGGAGIALVAPGGAILFLFPPAVAAIGMIAARRHPQAERIGAIAAAIAAFLILAPMLDLFEELMSNGPHWMFAPLGAAILLPALIELMPLAARIPRAFLVAGAGDLFLLGWAAAALAPAYSEARKQLFTIDYVWDADARTGRWTVNNDGAPVPHEAPWRRIELAHSPRERWAAPAPALAVAPPALERVGEQRSGAIRRIRLRLRMNGAQALTLIAPPDSGWQRAGAGGFVARFGGLPSQRSAFRCVGRSCDGALVEIITARATPVEVVLVGTRSGLPPEAAPLVRARPALAQPQYAPDSTIVIDRVGI